MLVLPYKNLATLIFHLKFKQTTYTNPLGPYLRNIILLHDFLSQV